MSTLEKLGRIVPTSRLHADGVPSASIAILENGNVTASVITSGTEDTGTIYQACSISKAIAALAVAKLIDEGHFTHDTLVANHLSQDVIDSIAEPETAHLFEHVSVRMLVSHTSGLSQGGFPGYANELPSPKDILSGDAPSNTPKVRFIAFPGAQFIYSGGGLLVLQLFLEQIMEVPFAELMHATVLQPLGMSRSHYGSLASDERNSAEAFYTAYTRANAPYHRFVELAAAGLWTTPTDLLKTISAVQKSLHGQLGFLRQESAREMLTLRNDSKDSGMALGWRADAETFGHRGDNEPGYKCYAFGFHGGIVNTDVGKDTSDLHQNGVAVMTNSALGTDCVRRLVSAIFYLKSWPSLENVSRSIGSNNWVPYADPRPETIVTGWQKWVGSWGREWRLLDENGPMVAFKEFPPARLMVAAAPVLEPEWLFVAAGLLTVVRLTQNGGDAVVEVLQGGVNTLLRRSQ